MCLRVLCDFLALAAAIILQLLLQHVTANGGSDGGDDSGLDGNIFDGTDGQWRLHEWACAATLVAVLTAAAVLTAQLRHAVGVEALRAAAALSAAAVRTCMRRLPSHVASAHRHAVLAALRDARRVGAAVDPAVHLAALPFLALAATIFLYRLLEVPQPPTSPSRHLASTCSERHTPGRLFFVVFFLIPSKHVFASFRPASFGHSPISLSSRSSH